MFLRSSKENRKLLTKYYFGNVVFWLLCATFGFVSYSFLSFSFQFLYELFNKDASYPLLSSGAVFIIMGTTFLTLKKIKLDLGFRSLVWTIFFALPLMYWGCFFANAYPKISLYIFVPVYFLISFLMLLFIVSWKRSGGLPMVTSFLLGVFSSGIFSYLYGVDFGFIAVAVRTSAILFLIFSIIYLVGWFGIFKTRLYFVGVLACVLMLVVLYPFNTETAVEKFKRFKWGRNKTVVGVDYEYIGSYTTLSRNIDAFMKNTTDKEEMRFVENGTLSPYAYPIQDKYKFGFYELLMQNKTPKKILSVGDIPSGFVSVFDNFTILERVDYLPIDPLYPEFWANFIHDDVFQSIRIVHSYSGLKNGYDLVLLFPPHVKGVGAAPYIGKLQLQKLKKVMAPSGTFVIVTPSDYAGLDDATKSNLSALFKHTKTVKLVAGLIYTESSDDISNISFDPAVIKYRLLQTGIKKDYAEIKAALDSGAFFEKGKSLNDFDKNSVNDNVPVKYLSILTIMMLTILALVYQKVERSRKLLSYIGAVLMFAVLGAVFGLYALSHQRMFIDLNALFPMMLSILLVSCGLGLLLGLWMKTRFNMLSMLAAGSLLFVIPMLYKYFFASTAIGKDDAVIMSVILGASSLLIFGTKLWNSMNVTVANITQLLGITLIGLGVGLIATALFDYNRMNLIKTDGYFLITSLCVIALFAAQIKFKGELE
jgi:hypothetical protein